MLTVLQNHSWRKANDAMAINPRFGFAPEYVKDVDQGRRFYEDVLGRKAEWYHPTFVQFAHFAIANDESLGGPGEPELYWLVDDAEAAFRELSERATVSLPLREMPLGKVFAILDADGRPRYLQELARNRPSQPVG